MTPMPTFDDERGRTTRAALKENEWLMITGDVTEDECRRDFLRKFGQEAAEAFQPRGVWYVGPVPGSVPRLTRYLHPDTSAVLEKE